MARASKTPRVSDTEKPLTEKPSELFKKRQSQELVIAVSGPIGCGLDNMVPLLKGELTKIGYNCHTIKLSKLIKEIPRNSIPEQLRSDYPELSNLASSEKYQKLQSAGDILRKAFGLDILGELAIGRIANIRTKEIEVREGKAPDKKSIDAYVPPKTAFIIDQLKHPKEAELLKIVYGNLFYLIGVFSSEEQRKQNLVRNLNIDPPTAVSIMEADRKGKHGHEQQLEKTLQLADLFIRNTHQHINRSREQISRFLGILHGSNTASPTQHEFAMYTAHIAGLSSACLSRQVGASITDLEGNILSTGCNDVPKPGGGLYNESSTPDSRCMNMEGKCYNDHYKELLRNKIQEIISNSIDEMKNSKNKTQLNELDISEFSGKLSKSIKSEAGLKDLLEYSRSVHAEMDAITTLARINGSSTLDAYLYTTTYPCHHCARHIIAAGIKKVFYIEPYEKSLARELHRDAIEIDPEDDNSNKNIVQFLHFEGIAPNQYHNFFLSKREKKSDSGKLITSNPLENSKIVTHQLDAYRDMESKVIKHLQEADKIPDNVIDLEE